MTQHIVVILHCPYFGHKLALLSGKIGGTGGLTEASACVLYCQQLAKRPKDAERGSAPLRTDKKTAKLKQLHDSSAVIPISIGTAERGHLLDATDSCSLDLLPSLSRSLSVPLSLDIAS